MSVFGHLDLPHRDIIPPGVLRHYESDKLTDKIDYMRRLVIEKVWRARRDSNPNHQIRATLNESEMVADNLVGAILDFRHCTTKPMGLCNAMETLNPDIKRLDDQQREILRNGNLRADLLNSLKVDQANAAYLGGFLLGLHIAGRADLVLKESAIDAETTSDSEIHFARDVEMISKTH